MRRGPAGGAVRTAMAVAAVLALTLGPAASSRSAETYFYRPGPAGSDAQFNPLTSFVNYGLDATQIRRSFDDEDLKARSGQVWGNLRNPAGAIREEGGLKAFVNRQVLPVDPESLADVGIMLPNYALHLLGGGMVFRKNAEWFEAHGFRYPRAAAAALGMGAEVLQEVTEKKSTTAEDEVADVWIFRPAGMLLFCWDPVARFAARDLGMLEWPYQAVYLAGAGRIGNTGQNYVVRPALWGRGDHRPFLFFGMTTLAGGSHRVAGENRVSWGLGAAVVDARRRSAEVRPSAGLFWDRDGSLFASLILNGTEGLAARLNIHPGVTGSGPWSPGLYLGLEDAGGLQAGAILRWAPVGWGAAK